jgi:hypothetical protein
MPDKDSGTDYTAIPQFRGSTAKPLTLLRPEYTLDAAHADYRFSFAFRYASEGFLTPDLGQFKTAEGDDLYTRMSA